MAAVTLEHLVKTFPDGHRAVDDVDLRVEDGEFLVLVGPSGCGKSTLLRLIAGLDAPSAGRILIDEQDMTMVPPQDRDLAMVFQSYALYPHMSVRENLAYSLRVRRSAPAEIEARVTRAAEALGIGALLNRRPAQLSGGERQRVALGRALVREPKAFLLDEPLSNLDPALRQQARAELLRLQRRLGATMIYVTHDQEDAMTLGMRVAVMRAGRLEQVGTPLDVYANPVNTFVAGFIGSPTINLLPADRLGLDAPRGALVGVRPQDVALGVGSLSATVDVVEPRGHDAVVHLQVEIGEPMPVVAVTTDPPAPGSRVTLAWKRERQVVFDERGRRWPG